MREIVLDTETTGLYPEGGDRLIEIGCVELWNRMPTGKVYHAYVNPERDVPEVATQITGLSETFLKEFPPFRDQAQAFLDFVKDSSLIIHNAKFDMAFLNNELALNGYPTIPFERAIDTLLMARQKFPGSSASLDALSRRFNVKIPREKHGALLDAKILTEVYIELMGGRQRSFLVESAQDFTISELLGAEQGTSKNLGAGRAHGFPERHFSIPASELAAFQKMLEGIDAPVWRTFFPSEASGEEDNTHEQATG